MLPRARVTSGRSLHLIMIATGGASDANALIPNGLPVVNLANGTEHAHEPTERVSVAALEGMLDVCLALLDETAALE